MTDTFEAAPEVGEDDAPATEEEAEYDAEWQAMVAEKTGDTPAKEGELDWTGFPEQKAAFDAMTERADKAEHGKKSAEGRTSAVQRKMDAVMAGGGSPPPTRTAAPSPASQPSQAFQEVLEEYPDIAKPFAEELNRVSAGYRAEIDGLKHSTKQMAAALQTVGEDRLAAHSESEEAIVRQSHPDFDDISDSDDFVAWANEQPEFMRNGIIQNAETIMDAESVKVILDKYKADKGIATSGKANPRRDIQLRSNRGTPSSSPGAPARDAQGRFSRETEGTYESEWKKMVAVKEREEKAAEARR